MWTLIAIGLVAGQPAVRLESFRSQTDCLDKLETVGSVYTNGKHRFRLQCLRAT